MADSRRIHGGLILAAGLLGVSLSVLILGASRGQSSDAGLADSVAADFSLSDAAGTSHRLNDYRPRPVVLVVAARDAKDFAKSAAEVNQILDTFAKDQTVTVVGVQVSAEVGLLDNTAGRLPGVLELRCPGLSVLSDTDGRVAQAYRVPETPTAFVIDGKGVIKARVPLDHDGAAVTVVGTVSSLRPVNAGSLDLH